jgi:hypothetical protein
LGVLIYQNFDSIVEYVQVAWDRIKGVFDVNFFDGLIQIWLEGWQALGNGIASILKSILPEKLMPDALKNFQFEFASKRAEAVTGQGAVETVGRIAKDAERQQWNAPPPSPLGVDTDTESATAIESARLMAPQEQNIKNTLDIRITSEGRPVIQKMTTTSPQSTHINVDTGLLMAGA